MHWRQRRKRSLSGRGWFICRAARSGWLRWGCEAAGSFPSCRALPELLTIVDCVPVAISSVSAEDEVNYPVMKSCKLQVIVIGCAAIAGILLAGCKSVHNEASALTEIGPAPDVRVSLMADGLPQNFFLSGADTECGR